MLSCIIDAYENRNLATVDVPGTVLQKSRDDLVYMRICGDEAKQLVKANPGKFAKRGEPYIITRHKKVVYGMLKQWKLFL